LDWSKYRANPWQQQSQCDFIVAVARNQGLDLRTNFCLKNPWHILEKKDHKINGRAETYILYLI